MTQEDKNKVVSLEDFKQSQDQMEFFFIKNPEDNNYSNSIDFYDALPKYFWGTTKRTEGKYLSVLQREFHFKGKSYELVLSPARIVEKKEGKIVSEKDHYPGLREELVEDALRKMACDGSGRFLSDNDGLEEAGVVFSLYALNKELAKQGHNFKITELKEAILVCSKTNIEVRSEDGEDIISSNVFSTVGLTTRKKWVEKGADAKCFVRFNPFVTRSIKEKTFRQFNYQISMQYRTCLARWLHKRLSHNYRQASRFNNYNILLSTIVRDSGVKKYKQISDQIRDTKKALEELIDKNVITKLDEKTIYSEQRRNKIEDVKWTLYPHPKFVSEMMEFNKRVKAIQDR
jgi:hypothetical protein